METMSYANAARQACADVGHVGHACIMQGMHNTCGEICRQYLLFGAAACVHISCCEYRLNVDALRRSKALVAITALAR